MGKPLPIQRENSMPGASQCFALRIPILLKPIGTDNVPRAVLRKAANPRGILSVRWKPLAQVLDDLDVCLELRQLSDASRDMGRKVVVEEKLQAASFSS